MLPMLSIDKSTHLNYGALVGCLAASAAALVGLHAVGIAITAAIVSAAVGVGKEFYDRNKGGTSDWKDAVATVAGGLLVSVPFAVAGLL